MTLSNLSSSSAPKSLANLGICVLMASSISERSLTPKQSSTFSINDMTTDVLMLLLLAEVPQTISNTFLRVISLYYGKPHL